MSGEAVDNEDDYGSDNEEDELSSYISESM